MKSHAPHNPGQLRKKAEEQVRNLEPDSRPSQTNAESQRSLHELHVHQIELEMQNKELQESRNLTEVLLEKYTALYDFAPVGYFSVNETGSILEANLTAATLLGTTRSALVKQPISRFILKDDQDMFYLHSTPIFENHSTGSGAGGCKSQECELRMVKPDSSSFWVHLTTTIAHSEDGTPFCCCVLIDITERKRAEEERKKLQDQLTQAQKMESIGRLAGGVAHDFNNIVMGIMGYTDMCRDNIEADHPMREWLDEITHEAERSAKLTRQLLAFARKQTVAPKVLDLNMTVADMLKMLRQLIGEDIDLSWQPGEGLWPVKLDPGQVDQILANLCVNARDAIGGIGKVIIQTQNVDIDANYCEENPEAVIGAYVMLAISDDGCGMNKETMAQVFEPFFTTKGVGEGTGLGLSTVYGIVKQNGGFVNAYSEPGRGTTFRVYLPRDKSRSAEVTEAAAKKDLIGGSEKILLVEDEQAILTSLRIFLKRLGYTVMSADCPEEALRMMAEHRDDIDLLITDVVMPGMSGRDLARKLAPDFPSMKVLYMSGYTGDVIAHRGILEEDVEFIPKPFSREEFSHKVHEILKNQ